MPVSLVLQIWFQPYWKRSVLISNPGFPFQILSCSFGAERWNWSKKPELHFMGLVICVGFTYRVVQQWTSHMSPRGWLPSCVPVCEDGMLLSGHFSSTMQMWPYVIDGVFLPSTVQCGLGTSSVWNICSLEGAEPYWTLETSGDDLCYWLQQLRCLDKAQIWLICTSKFLLLVESNWHIQWQQRLFLGSGSMPPLPIMWPHYTHHSNYPD